MPPEDVKNNERLPPSFHEEVGVSYYLQQRSFCIEKTLVCHFYTKNSRFIFPFPSFREGNFSGKMENGQWF
ncbi:hypothetical protein [Saccharococcus thermophilus]|jgi:hypothetical protein|uniref:hypothetical protein n=1 Tax=Saccharococcus thermophilus TaxID=29396 RepID=UPI0036D2FB90